MRMTLYCVIKYSGIINIKTISRLQLQYVNNLHRHNRHMARICKCPRAQDAWASPPEARHPIPAQPTMKNVSKCLNIPFSNIFL